MTERDGPARESLSIDQSGFTLVELIVAMGVFLVFTTIFLAAVLGLARSTSQVKLTSQSTGEVLVVFQNLDRQIRYADAINFPGTGASGARYFEFRTPAASSASGVTTCTQWRYLRVDGRIQSRRWDDVAGAVPSAWATKLTNSTDIAAADYPFKLLPARAGGSSTQQLQLRIETGRDGRKGGTDVLTSFVARNSSIDSPSNRDLNGDSVSDAPVCLARAGRP